MSEQKRYDVIVSARARQMLGTHVGFIANVSITAARNTRADISKAIRSLASMPQRHPFLENEYLPRNKYHKMVVDRYLLIYQIKEDVVYVDYILDCRKDYSWLLK